MKFCTKIILILFQGKTAETIHYELTLQKRQGDLDKILQMNHRVLHWSQVTPRHEEFQERALKQVLHKIRNYCASEFRKEDKKGQHLETSTEALFRTVYMILTTLLESFHSSHEDVLYP